MKIIFITLLYTCSLFAQSLQQMVKEGLKQDPNIQTLTYDYRLAVKDVELVTAHYRPTLDISAFIGRERSRSAVTAKKSKILNTQNAVLTGKYNLFSGYKNKYLKEEKETAVKLAENKLKEAIINLSQEISFAYINMLKRHKIYNKYQNNIKNYQETLRKVQFKIDAGGDIDSNLFQTKSRMNYEETNLITAQQLFQDSQISLAKFIKRTPSISHMKDPSVKDKYLKLKRLKKNTKKYNTTLGNLIFQKEIAYALVGQEESNYYPSLDLEMSQNWSDNQHGVDGIDNSRRIGINLKYNIYNGGVDKLNIEKARLQTLRSGSNIADAQREVMQNVSLTYNNYVMSIKKLSAIQRHIVNAKKTEVLYKREEEETGGRSIIDILNIQQESNAAEIAKIQTEYNIMQLKYQLIASTSEILNHFKITK